MTDYPAETTIEQRRDWGTEDGRYGRNHKRYNCVYPSDPVYMAGYWAAYNAQPPAPTYVPYTSPHQDA